MQDRPGRALKKGPERHPDSDRMDDDAFALSGISAAVFDRQSDMAVKTGKSLMKSWEASQTSCLYAEPTWVIRDHVCVQPIPTVVLPSVLPEDE